MYLRLLLVTFLLSSHFLYAKLPPSYYSRGFTAHVELGDNSAPGTKFPFGTGLGFQGMFNSHTLGFRHAVFSDLQIFVRANRYVYDGVYYGYQFNQRHYYVMPSIAVGATESRVDHLALHNYSYGIEGAIETGVYYRGNGISIRGLLHWDPDFMYSGVTIQLRTGWMWNDEDKN
jgi:hypothetical protein